ncbi:MAG: hypothetical protein JWO36_2467 [Myxococcales bacterium]|nr:hypothetical protein [Myxococcales bacterium]
MMRSSVWLVGLLACRGGSEAKPDASPDSVAIDAPVDAPGCGAAQPVTVEGPALPPGSTVTLDLTVVSHDANGAVCNRATASGSEASITIDTPPSGMITMIVNSSAAPRVQRLTWTLVQPGEHLLYPSFVIRGATNRTLPVSLSIAALTGATSYDLTVMCERAGTSNMQVTPGTIAVDVTCIGSAQHVTARVRANVGSATSFAVGDVVPIASTGTTTIPMGAWMNASLLTATIHGGSAFDQDVIGAAFAPTPGGFGTGSSFRFAPGGDPVTIGPVEVPGQWGGISFVALDSSMMPRHALELAQAYTTPSAYDLTVGTSFLPPIDATLDAAFPRAEVTWHPQSAMADTDLVIIKVTDWTIIAPGHPGKLRYPALPVDLMPTATTSLIGVCTKDSIDIAGYDAARLDPFAIVTANNFRGSCFGDPIAGDFF